MISPPQGGSPSAVGGPAAPGRLAPFAAAALVFFTVLTAAVTYPQIRGMNDHVADAGDPLLNTWALAWVAHQLPYSPSHVFDGNIFHPERRTLAYSETLLAPALMGAPLLWLGARPILVYNLLFFGSYVLSGLAMAVLVLDLTGRRSAALVAGTVFAFLPFRVDHFSHFQLLQMQWMPLALWFFHRVLARGRLRDGVLLGVCVGAQALSSMYNAIFLGVYMAVVGGVLLLWTGLTRRRLLLLGAAVAVAGALMTPAVVAHMRAREVVGARSKAEARSNSAVWTDFLASVPYSTLHGGWSERFGGPERRLFPGFVAALLALFALWPPWSITRVAYAMGLLFAADMARGFNGWTYGFLYDHLGILSSLRVPARMGMMVGVSVAVLAGYGVARLRDRLSVRTAAIVTAMLLAGVLADSWAPPNLTAVSPRAPVIYDDLLRDKGDPPRTTIIRRRSDPAPAVILELPLDGATTYMYYSTFHWQTLVNGYSGFFSGRYIELSRTLDQFPDDASQQALRTLGVRYVTVHGELMSSEDYDRIVATLDRMAPEFRIVNRRPWMDREISLYRFTPAQP